MNNLDPPIRVLLIDDDSVDLALSTTYFQGGVLPSDRVEIASNLFYVERDQSYRGVNTVAEARFTPTQRFNVIAGVEAVHDRERQS